MTDVPGYSEGAEGNGLQGGTSPPVELTRKEAGPAIVDASCFVGNAATCNVRFSKDIFPNMMSTGPWRCASRACHAGGALPPMSDSDVTGTYNALVNYELKTDGTQYVIPCNDDPSQSGMLCNLDPNSAMPCGQPMPETAEGAKSLTSADVGMISQWLMCGAPNN